MAEKYSFAIDRDRGLVRITMAGFYEAEDIAVFLRARREAHRELGLPANRHMTLNDVRAMKIQDQRIVDAFKQMLIEPAERSRKLAFVAEASLVRGQLMRAIAGRDDVACFDTIAEAEAWLFAEADAAPLRRASGR